MNTVKKRALKKDMIEYGIEEEIRELVLSKSKSDLDREADAKYLDDPTQPGTYRQKLLTMMEVDGTQTDRDIMVMRQLSRLMKMFDWGDHTFDIQEDHLCYIVSHIREYVRVGEVEKKEHGEVMTPLWLVEEMLGKLPEHVWSDPSLKWLDPCNGCGVFPSIVISRLMDGLKESIPDQRERYRHIIENMIHVCDIQAKNCFLHMVAFDPKDLFDMNIHCGSFLDEDFDKVAKDIWGVEKFDVIIGNPPYQELKPGYKKSKAIWNDFVDKSIDLLDEFGYLNFVHPSGWRNQKGKWDKLQKKMLSRNITYLEIHDVENGKKTFGAATRYDWYVLQNKNYDGKTEIKCQDGALIEFDMSGLSFIPNGKFSDIFSLFAKPGEEKVKLISDSSYHTQRDFMKLEKSAINKFPCVMNIGKDDVVSKIWWSDTNKNGHFGEKKVIFGRFGENVYIDTSGEYGLCQDARGIVDDEETLPKVKKAMQSKRFVELMKNCDVGGLGTIYNHRIIALFRKDFWKEFIDE